jgi:hypothetical protein
MLMLPYRIEACSQSDTNFDEGSWTGQQLSLEWMYPETSSPVLCQTIFMEHPQSLEGHHQIRTSRIGLTKKKFEMATEPE